MKLFVFPPESGIEMMAIPENKIESISYLDNGSVLVNDFHVGVNFQTLLKQISDDIVVIPDINGSTTYIKPRRRNHED